jgi:hypothetical protein
MNFQTLEDVRLFIGSTTHKLKVSAQTARLNGYKAVALELDNEAQFGDKILKELSQETTCPLKRL